MINRRTREIAKRAAHSLFALGQRLGVDVLPRHFYSEVPDLHALAATHGWRKERSMHGILGAELESQIAFVDQICNEEAATIPADLYQRAVETNGEDGGFGVIEAAFLYCFIRAVRPQHVIQVGCGVSTAIMLEAAESVDHAIAITCVDPYPTPYLQRLSSAEARVTLIAERAQDVELDRLIDLEAGDLFFVDSTHTVKPDSEVNRIVLEVLPRLANDVWVHFHDIYFPFDFAPNLLTDDLFFWSETALVHAFLVGNAGYRLCVAQSMLHHGCPETLSRWIPNYSPRATQNGLFIGTDGEFPASLFLKTTPT